MADPWTGGAWWPFTTIFFILLVMMIIRLVFWRRGWWGPRYGHWGHPYYGGGPPGHVPAEEILRQRLAKGEIDEEEYKRLKDALSK